MRTLHFGRREADLGQSLAFYTGQVGAGTR